MRINGQRSTPHVQEEYRNLGPIRYWVKRGDKTVGGPYYSRDHAEAALAQALPALNPTATEQQHATAAARIVADMEGGAK